jgi:hypothetical protein
MELTEMYIPPVDFSETCQSMPETLVCIVSSAGDRSDILNAVVCADSAVAVIHGII